MHAISQDPLSESAVAYDELTGVASRRNLFKPNNRAGCQQAESFGLLQAGVLGDEPTLGWRAPKGCLCVCVYICPYPLTSPTSL